MRILRNILLLTFPLALAITLYSFIINGNSEVSQYRGFAYIYESMQSFNGFDYFLDVLNKVGGYGSDFVIAFNSADALNALWSLLKMIGYAFYVPVALIVSIVQIMLWFGDWFIRA